MKKIELKKKDKVLVFDCTREDVAGESSFVASTKNKEDAQRILIGKQYYDETFYKVTEPIDPEERTEEKYIVDDEWFQVYGWMATRLKLTGNELLIYAIVYSFNMQGKLLCASQDYIAAKCGCTRKAVNAAIGRLVQKGILLKIIVQPENAIIREERRFQQEYTALACKRAMPSYTIVSRGDKHYKLYQAAVVQQTEDKNTPFGIYI